VKDILTGPYGALIVSVLVLIIEYLIVKPWLEAPSAGAGGGNVYVFIEKAAAPPPPAPPVVPKGTPTSAKPRPDSDDDVWLFLFGALAAIAITAAAFLSAYFWVVNVVIGIDVGLATFALLTHRRTVRLPIPQVRLWLVLSAITAVVGLCGILGVTLGRYQGQTISDLRGEVAQYSWLEAVPELIHRYDSSVMFFLAYKALGVLVIMLLCLYNITILTGITAALNARLTGRITWIRGRLIQHILPLASGPRFWLAFPLAMGWVIAILLTSGLAWDWIGRPLELPGGPAPTLTPTPLPPATIAPAPSS
jgi:hypothetical protein